MSWGKKMQASIGHHEARFNGLVAVCALLYQREVPCKMKTIRPMLDGLLFPGEGTGVKEEDLSFYAKIYPQFISHKGSGDDIEVFLQFFPDQNKEKKDDEKLGSRSSLQRGQKRKRKSNNFSRPNLAKLPKQIELHKKAFSQRLALWIEQEQDNDTKQRGMLHGGGCSANNQTKVKIERAVSIKQEIQDNDNPDYTSPPEQADAKDGKEFMDQNAKPKQEVTGAASNTSGSETRGHGHAVAGVGARGQGGGGGEEEEEAVPPPRPVWPEGARVTAENFLDYLTTLEGYRGQLAHTELVPGRPGEFCDFDEVPLPDEIVQALKAKGIQRLFLHQGTALRAVLEWKQHVALTTPTSSGKSLGYMAPLLAAAAAAKGKGGGGGATAFLVYPTKALARDQLASLEKYGELAFGHGQEIFKIACYDGDTPMGQRKRLRDSCQVLLVNPDILHASVLGGHKEWQIYLKHLAYVVVDEAHSYRGAFGAHVAQVFRRLRRVCSLYNSAPQFICCSATIANPAEHVENLVGVPRGEVAVIDEDGAPRGPRRFALWNPPELPEGRRRQWHQRRMPGGARRRESPYAEAAFVLVAAVQQGLRALAFVKVRHVAEHVLSLARARLPDHLRPKLAAYRGGLTPAQRRALETDLKGGNLCGLITTNALELGIDIGDLDITIHVGYPGTVCSLWQQAGRAGRAGRPSTSVLCALDGPLDQRLCRHPETLFGRPTEAALADPHNPVVLMDHLRCAASEAPFALGLAEVRRWHGDAGCQVVMDNLGREFEELQSGVIIYCGTKKRPAIGVNMRSIDSTQYQVTDTTSGAVYETMESWAAFLRVYEGAVYVHQGNTYVVEELDLTRHVALVRRRNVNYYTEPRDHVRVHILATKFSMDLPLGVSMASKAQEGCSLECFLAHGPVTVRKQVYGYRHRDKHSTEIVEMVDVFLPPLEYQTYAIWLELPEQVKQYVTGLGRDYDKGGLHSLEHVLIALIPSILMCDPADLSCQHTRRDGDLNRDKLLLFETQRGGLGLCQRLQHNFLALLQMAKDTILSCSCNETEGCLSCIQMGGCGEYNEGLDKNAALDILSLLLPAEEEEREV